MITADVDLKELERELVKTAEMFGEANETGIARWGVAVARRLVVNTQAWGDGRESKIKQEGAMRKDAHRVAIILKDQKLTRKIMKKSLGGINMRGVAWEFRPHQNITTPQGLSDWIELNRTGRDARPPKRGLQNGVMCVTTETVFKGAMRIRLKRAGKAKGGWIGAGNEISKFQRIGSRLTIGKNVANFAYKHSSGGTAKMKRDIWSPEGTMVNNFRHVSNEHVLKKADMEKSIADAARNTITWYEKSMQGRLNKKR